jgi:hypothetical protein
LCDIHAPRRSDKYAQWELMRVDFYNSPIAIKNRSIATRIRIADTNMEFTVESVLSLAPDDSSSKAARGLVAPARWATLGFDSAAVWGECKGSGAKPYQVQVDLSGPTFKCSCPSRKFPCKHGLALMLLRVQQAAAFGDHAERPAWLAEWLEGRQQRAAKQTQKSDSAAPSITPERAAATAARREAAQHDRIAAALDDLAIWLADHARHGLASLPSRGDIWSNIAARMVDAQLPGLATRLRQMRDGVGNGEHWATQLLGELGQVQLLIDAWRNLDRLAPGEQADVRTALGLGIGKDELARAGETVQGCWLVLGQSFVEEGKLWRRRVWLREQTTGRPALLLDFSHGGRRFEQSFMSGAALDLELNFYPGASPLRAAATGLATFAHHAAPPACTLTEALDHAARLFAANPWQPVVPMTLGNAVPVRSSDRWEAHTPDGAALPLDLSDADGWPLAATGGGHPLTLMGEWNGQQLCALSAWQASGQAQPVWTRGDDA